MRIVEAARNRMLNSLNDEIGPGGWALGYTLDEAIPAHPGVAPTGLRLFKIQLADIPLAAAAGGQIAFKPTSPVAALASGSLAYLRIARADESGVLDFPASELTLPGPLGQGSAVTLQSLIAILPMGL